VVHEQEAHNDNRMTALAGSRKGQIQKATRMDEFDRRRKKDCRNKWTK